MQKIKYALIGLIFTLFIINPLLSSDLKWNTNLAQAILQARKQKKLLLIHFYTPHCPYCKKIQRETFKDNNVIQQLKPMILVKIDLTKQRRLGYMFQVRGVPDTRLYQSDGKTMILRYRGFVSATDLSKQIIEIKSFFTKSRKDIKNYQDEKDKNKKQKLALKVAHNYYALEKYADAVQYFSKSILVSKKCTEHPRYHKEFGFSLMARGNHASAINQLNIFLGLEKKGTQHWYARFLLAYSQMNLGKNKEAMANVNLVLENSKSKSILNEAKYLKKQLLQKSRNN